MQSFDTDDMVSKAAGSLPHTIVLGRVEDLPVGSRKTVELPNEREIALYDIDGEFYATTTTHADCPRGDPGHREFLPW